MSNKNNVLGEDTNSQFDFLRQNYVTICFVDANNKLWAASLCVEGSPPELVKAACKSGLMRVNLTLIGSGSDADE